MSNGPITTSLKETYMNNIIKLLQDIFKIYNTRNINPEKWEDERERISSNITLCFDYLIIPNNVLDKALKKVKQERKDFVCIQKCILTSLESRLIRDFNNEKHIFIIDGKPKHVIETHIQELYKNIELLNEKTNEKISLEINFEEIKNTLSVSTTTQKNIDDMIKKLNNLFIKYSSMTLINEDLLTRLCNNTHIFSTCSFNIQKFREIKSYENDIRKIIINIYNKLIEFRYSLYMSILSIETMYILGFIWNTDLFREKDTASNKYKDSALKKVVDNYTSLYRYMYRSLPKGWETTFEVTPDTSYDGNTDDKNQNLLFYNNLLLLINLYNATNNKTNELSLKNSEIFNTYCERMSSVCTQTNLLFPDVKPKEYTNLERFWDLVDIKGYELAEVMGISNSDFSRKKNSEDIETKFASKLSLLFNLNENFLRNRTTILLDGERLMPVSIVGANAILEQFKSFYSQKEEDFLSQMSNVKKYMYLISLMNLLENKIADLHLPKKNLPEKEKDEILISNIRQCDYLIAFIDLLEKKFKGFGKFKMDERTTIEDKMKKDIQAIIRLLKIK